MTKTFIAFVAVALAGAVVWGAGRGPGPVGAQATYAAGVSVALRAERATNNPGGQLPVEVSLANAGTAPATIELGCGPAFDVQVRDGQGGLVWRLNPTCAAAVTSITLAPGEDRAWAGVWPGTDQAGAPVAAGVYSLWAVVETVPLVSIAGPVLVSVGGAVATPVEPIATASPTRRPDEPTRAPTGVEPTRTPTPFGNPTGTATPGDEAGGERFPIVERDGNQRRPDVAGNPEQQDCQNLVVWWDEGEHEIRARFVEPHFRGEPFSVSGDTGADGPPAVAYNVGRRLWLVVWSDEVGDAGRRLIRARFVDCGGVEGNVFALTDDGGVADQPDVAAFGETFAVVWRVPDGDRAVIRGARVAEMAAHQVVTFTDDDNPAEPAVACEFARACVIVWSRGGADARDVVGRSWVPHEEAVGARALDIATTDRVERLPAVAWNGSDAAETYLVTWTDEGGDYSTVRARAVYPPAPRGPDDYVVGQPDLQVSEGAQDDDHGDVAPLEAGFVVVWATGRLDPEDILARRVTSTGGTRALAGQPVIGVSDAPASERFPAVAASGATTALAVWESQSTGGDVNIFGRHFAAGGGAAAVSLVGFLGPSGTDAAGAWWDVAVSRVMAGSYSCGEARVYYEPSAGVDPTLRSGEAVAVNGRTRPEACTLQADVLGIVRQTLRARLVHLPYALRP